MTLNITVLSRAGIYQSADFRLSARGVPLDLPSTKRIIVTYTDWSGFITYTGVGMVGAQQTSDLVRTWVTGISDLTFDDLVEAIRAKGSVWLQRVGIQRHTFVIAAFVKSRPLAAIVSNYQRWHGAPLPAVSKELMTSVVAPTAKSEVIVTGVHEAISRNERRALGRLVDSHPLDALRIRHELVRLNEEASRRFPKLISEDCVVYSQDQHGRGHESHHGPSDVRSLGVMNGVDVTAMLLPFLDKEFGPGQWTMKGASFARSGDRGDAPPSCDLELAPGSAEDVTLTRLAEAPGRRATPRAINARGMIVGEAAPEWGAPEYPCMWPAATVLEFLEHLGGFGGQALGINDSGLAVGWTETDDRSSHACAWIDARVLTDLHPGGGRSSGARSVSKAGAVAGWLAVHPTEHGQAHYRPAIWSSTGLATVIANWDDAWGEAIEVSDNLLVGGFRYEGRDCKAWVWDGVELEYLGAPPPPCRSFIPSRLTAGGGITGTQILADGSRHVGTWVRDAGWSGVLLPAGSDPTAFDGAGLVAGRRLVDGLYLPWLLDHRGLRQLPHFRYHHHNVAGIGPAGRVFGVASSDRCSHPLVWNQT